MSEGGDFQEPPEEAKLFVGNLAYDADSQALATLFEQAGTVEIAEVSMTLLLPSCDACLIDAFVYIVHCLIG